MITANQRSGRPFDTDHISRWKRYCEIRNMGYSGPGET